MLVEAVSWPTRYCGAFGPEDTGKCFLLIRSCRLLPRKALQLVSGCPYRKPTQVGEERIHRRAREPSLRNSANWTRNFGIRVAFWCDASCRLSTERPQ